MNQSLTDSPVMPQAIQAAMNGDNLVEVLALFIPITLFICMAVIFALYFYYLYKTRRDLQNTVQTLVEKGQELTPELLERLGQQAKPAKSDLRRGVTLMATGIAIAVFGFVVGESDAVRPMLAIGLFPFILGLAFVGLRLFSAKEKN